MSELEGSEFFLGFSFGEYLRGAVNDAVRDADVTVTSPFDNSSLLTPG